MQKLKLFLDLEKRFASLSSEDVVYADDSEEFYYEDTQEPVPEGEAVGIDIPMYDFEYLQYADDVKSSDQSKDADKWRYGANQEYESLLGGHIPAKEVKLTLFNNIVYKTKEG
jgi:hypothetical protein